MSLRRQGSFGLSLALLVAGCEDYNCLDLANCKSPVDDAGVATLSSPPTEGASSTVAASSFFTGVDTSQVSMEADTTEANATEANTTEAGDSDRSTTPHVESTADVATTSDDELSTTQDDTPPLPSPDSGTPPEVDAGDTPVCVVDETTCTQDNRLQMCGSEGQWGEPTDCPFLCVAGECAGECVPEDSGCNEFGQVVGCTPNGTWTVLESCAALCEDGECVDECTDDTFSCAGDVLSRCESGLLVAQETCEFLCDADAGACVGECNPNDTLCIEGQLATCGADALFGAGVECTNVCLGTNCGGECKPEAVRCKSSQVQQTCSASGEWDDEVCEFVCVDDECGGVCIPGARRCLDNGVPSASGSQSQLCNENGQWTAITACVESCQNTQCTGLCESGSQNECVVDDGEPALRVCTDGQWVTSSCDYVCSGGACSGVCEPGAARCNNGARETCSAAGAWSGASCSAGQVCQGDGQCLAKPTISTLTATGTALQAGRVDGKTGVSVAAGTSTTLSWTLSGGAPTSITLAPTSGSTIAPGATSVSVTPTKTQDYVLTVTNAAGSSSKTITLAVVSAGTKKYIRHFGSGGFEESMGLELINADTLVSVGLTNGIYSVGGVQADSQPFLAVHAIANGAVQKIKPIPTADASALRNITRDGTDFVAVGGTSTSRSILRFDANLSTTNFLSFQVGAGYQLLTGVAVDSAHRVLVGGAGTVSTLTQALTGRVDRSVSSDAVEFDQSNNILVGGGASLKRYAASLTAQPTSAQLPASVTLRGIAIDHAGSVLVAGETGQEGYVAKFSNNLQTEFWSLGITNVATGLCVDEADNVVVVSYYGDDLAVNAFSPAGNPLWDYTITDVGNFVYTTGIVCDDAGNVFALGHSRVPIPGSTGYIADFDGFLIRLQ